MWISFSYISTFFFKFKDISGGWINRKPPSGYVTDNDNL